MGKRDNWDGILGRARAKDEPDESAILIEAGATDKRRVGLLVALPPARQVQDKAHQPTEIKINGVCHHGLVSLVESELTPKRIQPSMKSLYLLWGDRIGMVLRVTGSWGMKPADLDRFKGDSPAACRWKHLQ